MIDNEYIVIGSEEKCRYFERILDFGGDGIEAIYNQLFPEYQKIFIRILKKIVGSEDHFGYNLKQVINYYRDKKESQPNVSQRKLLTQIEKKHEIDFLKNEIESLTKSDFKKLLRDPKSRNPQNEINKYPYNDFISNLEAYVPRIILDDLYKEYKDIALKNFPDNISEYKLHELLEHLPLEKLRDLFEKSYKKYNGKSYATIETNFNATQERIHCPKDEGSDIKYYVDMFCENYLISIDVIKNGYGKCLSITSEWIDKINDDSDFQNYLSDFQWQGCTTLKYFKEYEKFLWRNNKLDENKSVFIEEYVVLKKCGLMYNLMQNEKKEENEKSETITNQYNTIVALIKELKILQVLCGKGIKQPDEWL